jgi:hypothetical protein
VAIPPPASIGILRRYGADRVRTALGDLGIADRGSAHVSDVIRRTDLGDVLRGSGRAAFEARGTPATTALPAFQLLADEGFNLGADKPYNRAIADALAPFLLACAIDAEVLPPETGLPDAALIPDNAIKFGDDFILCIEYTWRRGDFLSNAHRSDVAQYILTKLKNYAVAHGWIQP